MPINYGSFSQRFHHYPVQLLPKYHEQACLFCLIIQGKERWILFSRLCFYCLPRPQIWSNTVFKRGPFDFEKALVATIVSVVQPGIANTLSIRRDQWISTRTIDALPQVANLSKFLKDLLELPQTGDILSKI